MYWKRTVECTSVHCFATVSGPVSDLLNTRKPRRNAGAITFDKLPAYITLPSVSIDLIVGTFSPANLNSP